MNTTRLSGAPAVEEGAAGRPQAAVPAEGNRSPFAMDRGPRHRARHRNAARPVLAGAARRRWNSLVGRPHAARRGLCHDRRPHVFDLRFCPSDRVDRARIGRGWLALLSRPPRRGSDPSHADEPRPAAVRGHRPLDGRRALSRRGRPHGHHGVLGRRKRRTSLAARPDQHPERRISGSRRTPAAEPEPSCGNRKTGRGRSWS